MWPSSLQFMKKTKTDGWLLSSSSFFPLQWSPPSHGPSSLISQLFSRQRSYALSICLSHLLAFLCSYLFFSPSPSRFFISPFSDFRRLHSPLSIKTPSYFCRFFFYLLIQTILLLSFWLISLSLFSLSLSSLCCLYYDSRATTSVPLSLVLPFFLSFFLLKASSCVCLFLLLSFKCLYTPSIYQDVSTYSKWRDFLCLLFFIFRRWSSSLHGSARLQYQKISSILSRKLSLSSLLAVFSHLDSSIDFFIYIRIEVDRKKKEREKEGTETNWSCSLQEIVITLRTFYLRPTSLSIYLESIYLESIYLCLPMCPQFIYLFVWIDLCLWVVDSPDPPALSCRCMYTSSYVRIRIIITAHLAVCRLPASVFSSFCHLRKSLLIALPEKASK